MENPCAICTHVEALPNARTQQVFLETSVAALAALADRYLDQRGDGRHHVLISVCPEHVVEIYRGRVEDVAMAWATAPIGELRSESAG